MRRGLIFRRKVLFICFLVCIITTFLFIINAFNTSSQLSLDQLILEELGDAQFQHRNGCHIPVEPDPFDPELMKYMVDFGPHLCRRSDVSVTVADGFFQIKGFGIQGVKINQILANKDDLFKLGEEEQIFETEKVYIKKGYVGLIRHTLSSRCLTPSTTDYSEENIELLYKEDCDPQQASFVMTEDGFLKHRESKRCIYPENGEVKDNVKLMLSRLCTAQFEGLPNGLIRYSDSQMCVHPLWGGETPEEEQQVCLFSDCEEQERLKYHWLLADDKEMRLTGNTTHPFSFIQVQLKNQVVNLYSMHLVPKPLPRFVYEVLSPNIYIVSLDELSRNHFQRKLPSTVQYMEDHMPFVHFRLFASVSNSLRDNLLTILSGTNSYLYTENSLFRIGRSLHYATMFSSDETESFILDRFLTDHNSLPLFHAINRKDSPVANKHCINSRPIYDWSFEYLNKFISSYPNNPKMGVIVISDILKTNFNRVGYMDNSLKKLLEKLNRLQNTMVVLHSVKGSTIGKLGKLDSGLREVKQPILSIRLSPDIASKYEFAQNKDVLVTPYDLHLMLKEMMTQKGSEHRFGRTLLGKLNERNCFRAGIKQEMCACR